MDIFLFLIDNSLFETAIVYFKSLNIEKKAFETNIANIEYAFKNLISIFETCFELLGGETTVGMIKQIDGFFELLTDKYKEFILSEEGITPKTTIFMQKITGDYFRNKFLFYSKMEDEKKKEMLMLSNEAYEKSMNLNRNEDLKFFNLGTRLNQISLFEIEEDKEKINGLIEEATLYYNIIGEPTEIEKSIFKLIVSKRRATEDMKILEEVNENINNEIIAKKYVEKLLEKLEEKQEIGVKKEEIALDESIHNYLKEEKEKNVKQMIELIDQKIPKIKEKKIKDVKIDAKDIALKITEDYNPLNESSVLTRNLDIMSQSFLNKDFGDISFFNN
jgi:hypothetical protein